jgi:hypothetical protein
MKQKRIFTHQQTMLRRFVFPALLVLGLWLVMSMLYANAWKFDLGGVNTVIAWTCGLGDLIFRIFTPLIVYAIASPRGASLMEKVVASMVPAFAWAVHQLYLAAGVYSLGETVYYGFGSAFLFVFCLVISSIGVCELVFRMISSEQGLSKKRVLGPIMAIFVGPLSIFFLLIWGGGVHFFYVYQEGYKLFFH